MSVIHTGEAQALRETIYNIIRAQNDCEYQVLPDDARRRLAGDLTHACLRAREGVRGLYGSRAKPAAAVLDILVHDVGMALWRAGVPPQRLLPHPDPAVSLVQGMALRLAHLIGLTGHGGPLGSLYGQMRRARRFQIALAPDDEVADAWLDGRLVAELPDPAEPSLK